VSETDEASATTAAERTQLLGGRVICLQPHAGFRAAIDPVLMAAAVPAAAGDMVLDVGTGTGAAALCLAARVAGAAVVGLEVQAPLVALAQAGAEANGWTGRVRFVEGDILAPSVDIPAGGFDHVMANPPYLQAGRSRPSPDPAKAMATVEGRAKLADWVSFAIGRVRDGGSINFIHRWDRLDELIAALTQLAGGIEILPLLPKADAAPKRVIVRGHKGAVGATVRKPPLILHEADGAYTVAAEGVLRDGQSLLECPP